MIGTTRGNYTPDVIYVLPNGTAFVSPDGEGRYHYDSEAEARDDSLLLDPKVVRLTSTPDDWEG